jgi:hypothetical protein
MKKTLLILTALASLTIATYAKEIKVDLPQEKNKSSITLTGKLGSYNDPGEDGFTITITPVAGDVAIPAQGTGGVPSLIPIKRVAISNPTPELKKAALAGKTVTLRGELALWERHIKLGRPDVLMFTLAKPVSAHADDAAMKKGLLGLWKGPSNQSITVKENGVMTDSDDPEGSERWEIKDAVFHTWRVDKDGQTCCENFFKIISLTKTKFVIQDMYHGRHTGTWTRITAKR